MPLTDQRRAELDALVHSNGIVLFMKGNRRFPQCGFSQTVVGILDKLTKGYETVDILKDPSIRESMKEFSSWPTFPQLYVKGSFVGGCDIVKDLYGSGELQKLIGVEAAPAAPVKPPTVTITAAAAKAFQEAGDDGSGDVLRLVIDSQFDHDLHFGPKEAGDVAVTSAGVVLQVAADSAARADGIAIDFVEGPKGGGFKIDNPNEPPHVRPISPKALRTMLEEGAVQLFDVRPDAERELASIPQAKKLDALSGVAKDAPIALHCHHGVRSRAAAERLIADGFTHVFNLEGGIEAWSRDVDPSVPHY
jgi:monothiol glutaredoxin